METGALKNQQLFRSLKALPLSYLHLLAEFPLRPILSDAEYGRAAKIIHRLAMLDGKADSGQQAYLEVLESIVEKYDLKHSSFAPGEVSPTQVLRMLVGQAGMTVTELGKLRGSKGAASELLSGKRKEPSKSQVARLCERFKVNASAFLLPASRRSDAA